MCNEQLAEEIDVELQMLRDHLEEFSDLRQNIHQKVHNYIEIMALAGMLHAFYNGVENIFKRIAIHCDGSSPSGAAWHQNLLKSMTVNTENRRAVISEELREKLRDYLDFRHFFRQSYSFQFNWEKMAYLVENLEETFEAVESKLQEFLEKP